MSQAVRLLCSGSLILAMIGLRAQTAPIEIVSSELAMTIDAQAGKITRLRDTKVGAELLSPETTGPSWLLKLQAGKKWLGIWDAELTGTDIRETTGKGKQVQLDYTLRHEGARLDIAITITARPTRPEIGFEIDVRNLVPGLVIDAVHGPEIVLPSRLDEGGTERAFMGAGDGVETVMAGLKDVWSVREYPGGLSMQLCAYYSDLTGLAMAAHDTRGNPKSMGVNRSSKYDPGGVHFWMARQVPAEPNAEIARYPVVIFPARGDWRSAAEPYRDWALKQWWAQPKAEGQESPTWLRKGSLVIEANLSPEYCGLNTMPLDMYPSILSGWADALGGAALMTLNRNFERYGIYSSPHYWPLKPAPESLGGLWQAVHDSGHHTVAMVSGLVWQISRPIHVSGPAYWVNQVTGKVDDGAGRLVDGWSEVSPSGPEVCVVERSGKVEHKIFQDWNGTRSHMCPGHSYADRQRCYPRQVLVRLAGEMAALGLDVFEIDQMNGGRCAPCYSTVHGHPRGPGRWQVETVGEIMAACRAAGRARNPNFAMDMEDPGELFLPHLDIFGCRPQAINDWPALQLGDGSRPVSYTVPAFAFVYGHLLRSHSWDQGQNAKTSDHNLPVNLVKMAKTFSHGANLAVALPPWQLVAAYAPQPAGWTTKDGPYPDRYPPHTIAQTADRVHPTHLTLLRNAVRTMNGVASPYLNGGRMAHMTRVESPPFTYKFWDGEAKATRERTDLAVSCNAWDRRDGRRLFMAASADSTAEHTLKLPAEIDHASISANATVRIYRNGDLTQTVTAGALGGSITLAPLDVLALEILPVAKR